MADLSNPLRKRRFFPLGLIPLCALFLVLSSATDMSLTRTGVEKGYLADAGGATPSNVALAHAAGEFRIAAANVIWLQVVDHYHHQYMASGGNWAKNSDILPLLQMIVTLDPHFVQAYSVQSMILSQLGRYHEAIDHLQTGSRNNPDSWELQYDIGMVHAWYMKDPASALPYALRADEIAQDPFDKHRLDLFCATLRREILSSHAVGAVNSTRPAAKRPAA